MRLILRWYLAGTAAGLDCCLFLVRKYYGAKTAKTAKTANTLARLMVVPPHREGGRTRVSRTMILAVR